MKENAFYIKRLIESSAFWGSKTCVYILLVFSLVCLLLTHSFDVYAADIGVGPTIDVGSYTREVAWNPSNGYMYVCGDRISVIDGTTIITTIEMDCRSNASIAYNPDNGYMYVSGTYGIAIINGTEIIATIEGSTFYSIAHNPDNGYMYVSGHYHLSIIDGTTIIATIEGGYRDIAYNPGNGYIYATDFVESSVKVIAGLSLIATIQLDWQPFNLRSFAYNPDNGYMYLCTKQNVAVIDATTIIATIYVGVQNGYAISIVYNPDNSYIYVGSSFKVTVIDGVSKIATIGVPILQPERIAYNPRHGYIYVKGLQSDYVGVIYGTSLIGTIDIDRYSPVIGYNPNNSYMYVGNSNYITVLYERSQYIAEDTTFSLHESPYVVHSDLTILSDTTLIIPSENRVELKFEPNTGIIVNGELHIYSDSVLTSNANFPSPGDWNGIEGKPISTILISDSTIEYAKNGISGTETTVVNGGTIRNCGGDGIHLIDSAMKIRGSIIKNNNGNAIYMSGSDSILVDLGESTIENNGGCGYYLNSAQAIIYSPGNNITNNGNVAFYLNETFLTVSDANVSDSGPYFSSMDIHSSLVLEGNNTVSGGTAEIIEVRSGSIIEDKTLNANPFPYLFVENLLIDSGYTLNLEEGIEIRFPLNKGITVNGTLNINGTEQKHVVLSSAENIPEPGDWNGIVFQEGSVGTINHAHIEYGGDGPEQANITIKSGDVSIENSYISDSNNHGIYITGAAQPAIYHNSITNNTRGIYTDLTSSPSINNNFIFNNIYGLYCDTSGNPLVYLNDIFGNTIYGLFNSKTTTNIAATQNWWGDCSGPYNFGINPGGLGDPVNDYVAFAPWKCKLTPEVLSITPDNGFLGSIITIEGSNFMEGQGDSSLAFNGILSPKIYYWSDSRIVAEVPSGAITGPVIVTTVLGASNDDVIFTGPDNTLILSFPFEDDGGTTSDASVNGNHGTVNGAVFLPGGGILNSNAYQLNWSTQDNIQVPYQASQTATEALTLEAWIYPTAWDNIYYHYNRIVSKQPVYLLRGTANGHAHFQILTENHGYQGVYDSQVMSLNEWHYVVGTFDGLSLKLYVDGILRDSLELAEEDSISTNEADIFVGESQGLAEGFTGTIDNVAIYKRARSQSEIEETYASIMGCKGDLDGDNDVDGSDLATYAAGGTGITLEAFAADFGRTDCPD